MEKDNTTTQIENLSFVHVEVKRLEEQGTFEGYAAVTGNRDAQGDIIVSGAFKDTIRETKGKWPILFNHSWMRPIGYNLEAEEDDRGLKIVGEFTLESSDGRDAYASTKHALKRGIKPGLSIGYSIRKNGAEVDQADYTRKLLAINVHEYSWAIFPANDKARMRDVKSWTERDFESYLRDAGYSREAAKLVVSRGFKALADQREADSKGRESGASFLDVMAEARRIAIECGLKDLANV